MATKSRDPRDISHDDLTTWGGDMCVWLTDHAADLDLTPRAADFAVLSAAYTDAYHAEISPEQFSPLLHTELEALDDLLIGVLRTLQGRIPLLPGVDEPALADFGLGAEVENDWDKLVAVASVCKAHWEDISSVATPPEYLAVEVTMADMVAKVTEFLNKHAAYRAAIGDKQNAIAYKNTCLDALLECEREIFNWYDAAHPDGKDEWWRTTPWGCTGQASEPEEPEEPEAPEGVPFPGPMALFEVTYLAGLTNSVQCSRVTGSDNCVIERKGEGEPEWLVVAEFPIDADEILPLHDNVPAPGIYYYRATPYNAAMEPGISSEDTVEVT